MRKAKAELSLADKRKLHRVFQIAQQNLEKCHCNRLLIPDETRLHIALLMVYAMPLTMLPEFISRSRLKERLSDGNRICIYVAQQRLAGRRVGGSRPS